MCGIFAYLGSKKNAADLVLRGLKSLEYRGYDSWGVAIKKSNGQIYIKKQVGKIGNAHLPKIISSSGIGHTRWATHGGVSPKNTHPHYDSDKKVIIVHNGIVENFVQLKQELIKKGYQFRSETDSEVIAHLIAGQIKNKKITKKELVRILNEVFKRLKGLNAVIVFLPQFNLIAAIKNGSPLVFAKNNQGFFIASDASALVPYTKKVFFIEDNQTLVFNYQGENLYGPDNKEIKPNFVSIQYKAGDISLKNYPHYMIKEISEQPKVLTSLINNEKDNITKMAKIIRKAYGSYLIGCGTSYYACLSGTYLFSKIAKRHINATICSEFSYLVDFLKKESLVLALSQSGETIDIISSLRKVREKKAKIFSITNVLGSTLYRMADYKLLLNAGPEKCVLATKSFTAQVAILTLLAYSLDGGYNQAAGEIRKAIKEIKKLIVNKDLKKLAQKISRKEHVYVLGRGTSYPIALESALKIKEVSYIHAEGFAGGELKHGVIALIEKGTPVIIYNPQDETYADSLSSAYEVKARGAYVIGVSSQPSQAYNQYIKVDDCGEANPIANTVIAQLLGYYLALERGLDPDKPRNLAKSVTVK